MKILKEKDILKINKRTIDTHGGNYSSPDNVQNIDAFEYYISSINSTVFGEEIYPNIYDKAAFYLYKPNGNHIFKDGNKRTGLGTALLFLRINGHRLNKELVYVQKSDGASIPFTKVENTHDLLYNLVMEVADSKHTLEDCALWFKANIIKITPKTS
jgi:death-on-curing protein